MWSYPIGLGLLLIQKTSSLALSLAYAPVPQDENKGGGSLLWTIFGALVGILLAIIAYRVVNNLGKTKK